MTRARNSANLASHGNLFVDITNDRTGIGSVVPAQNLHVAGTAGFHADVTFTGDLYNATWDRSDSSLKFADSAQIKLGTGDDAKLRHDGSNTWIQNTTGYMYVDAQSSSGIRLISQSHWQQGAMAAFYPDGGVSLYHDANHKFSTTAYCTNTVGTAVNDGLVVAGVATVTTMNVTGVLTYDDVTSVDSIGIVTARQGVSITGGDLTISTAAPQITFTETNGDPDYRMFVNGGIFTIVDQTNNIDRFSITSSRITLNETVLINDSILYIHDKIVHWGDDNTSMRFPAADTISFNTNNVERLRIDSNGNIGVNATPVTSGTLYNTVDNFLVIGDSDTGIAQDGDGQFEIWANNQECANFNTSTITFTKTISIPDTIQHTGDTNTKIRFPSNDVISFETGGTERGRFTSNGLCLGGTGSANGLDDYEEGTFSPNYTSTNSNVSGVTYDARSGRYIKIGRLVYVSIRLRTDAINNRGSGSIRIGGLPFTHVNSVNGRAITSNIFSAGWTADDAPTQGLVQNNNTVMNLYQKEYNEDTVAMDVSRLNTGANDNDIRVSVMYETA